MKGIPGAKAVAADYFYGSADNRVSERLNEQEVQTILRKSAQDNAKGSLREQPRLQRPGQGSLDFQTGQIRC